MYRKYKYIYRVSVLSAGIAALLYGLKIIWSGVMFTIVTVLLFYLASKDYWVNFDKYENEDDTDEFFNDSENINTNKNV